MPIKTALLGIVPPVVIALVAMLAGGQEGDPVGLDPGMCSELVPRGHPDHERRGDSSPCEQPREDERLH